MMRGIRSGAAVCLAGMLLVSACSKQTAKSGGTEEAKGVAPANPGVAAPAGTKLSLVKMGMTKKQVSDILGQPDDEKSYASGKAWIPFYFGNDTRRTSWFYKSVGSVVFADGNVFGGGTPEVVRIDYNPNEAGVAK